MRKDDVWGIPRTEGLIRQDSGLPLPWHDTCTNTEDDTVRLGQSGSPLPSTSPQERSPDPWAGQAHVNPQTTEEGGLDAGSASNFISENVGGPLSSTGDGGDTTGSADIPCSAVSHTPDRPKWTEEGVVLGGEKTTSSSTEIERAPTDELRSRPLELDTELHETDQGSSRPSTSPSDKSSPGDGLQESPRTSLNEEPKRPTLDDTQRNTSKVKELVHHFDGLAKQEVEDVVAKPHATDDGQHVQPMRVDESEEDDFGDFGDFEQGVSDCEEEAVGAMIETKLDAQTNARTSVIKAKEIVKHQGAVRFDIALDALQALFSHDEVVWISDQAVDKVFIPDTPIHDTFTTTEQRKTWYRISREGTMRKFYTGDDENYVRISWAHANIRDETLKIVAGWMEEDRINGRVTLGGPKKATSIFGWNDAKATPVPLASTSPKRNTATQHGESELMHDVPREWPTGLARERSRSKGPTRSKSRKESISKSQAMESETKPDMAQPASFPWSTASIEPQTEPSVWDSVSSQRPVLDLAFAPSSKAQSTTTALDISAFASPWEDQLEEAFPTPRADEPFKSTQALEMLQSQAEDDDWGDLVASPPANLAQSFNEPITTFQPSSPSLEEGSRPNTASAAVHPKFTALQTGRGHKASVSFDEILSTISRNSSISPEGIVPSLPYNNVRAPSPSFDEILYTKPTSPGVPHPPPPSSRPIEERVRAPSVTFDQILSSPFSDPPSRTQTTSQSPMASTRAPSKSFDDILGSSTPPISSNSSSNTPTHASPLRNTFTASSTFPSSPSLLSDYPAPPPTARPHGPWASADFSLFETPSTLEGIPSVPALEPMKGMNLQSSIEKKAKTEFKTKEEIEQDRIVESVLRGLPDLGYMLRR